jgi:dipeptidyl aminopeptidase/acylaminoacyl peptidase
MRTPGYEADLQKIVIFNRKTSRKRIILENWDRSAESLLWSPDSQYLYITAQDKGHVKVYSVKVADESITELVSDFNAASINYLGGRDALLFLRSSPASPSEIFSLDLNGKDKPLVKLSSFNDEALSGMQLNSAEVDILFLIFWFKSWI